MDSRTRQDAIVGSLRGGGATTVGALATHFGVSARTMHRDLAALRARGIPVESEPGRGGGVRLDQAWSVPPVRFELSELVGLIVAVSLSQRASALPFGAPAQAALGKVVAALPTARAQQVRHLCRRVLVGPPASAGVVATMRPPPRNALERLEQAFSAHRALAFGYLDAKGQASRREAEPHGLLVQSPAWYLLAYDRQRQAPRTFRLDRMSRLRLLPQTFALQPLSMFQATLQHVSTAPAY